MYVHGDVKGLKSDSARDAQKANLVRREPLLASKTDPSAVRKGCFHVLDKDMLASEHRGGMSAPH